MTPVLIAFGLFLLLAFLVALGRVYRTAHEPIDFNRADPQAVEDRIAAVAGKLAARDSAAFAIYPVDTTEGDADGQIWLFAAGEDGVLDRIAIELALPDSVTDAADHSAVARFAAAGWEVQETRPGQWVLLSHSGLEGAAGLVTVVVDAVTDLFQLSGVGQWRCRPIA